MSQKNKVKKLLANIAKSQAELQEILGIDSPLDDYTNCFWTDHDSDDSFSWYEADSPEKFPEWYGGDVWGSVTRTEYFTIAHIDNGCGDGHPLCIFDNDKRVDEEEE